MSDLPSQSRNFAIEVMARVAAHHWDEGSDARKSFRSRDDYLTWVASSWWDKYPSVREGFANREHAEAFSVVPDQQDFAGANSLVSPELAAYSRTLAYMRMAVVIPVRGKLYPIERNGVNGG